MLSSGCTGWDPNKAKWAVSDSMMGVWELKDNPCLGRDADKTFYAQSTYVLPIEGMQDQFIAMFDRWNKTDLINHGMSGCRLSSMETDHLFAGRISGALRQWKRFINLMIEYK